MCRKKKVVGNHFQVTSMKTGDSAIYGDYCPKAQRCKDHGIVNRILKEEMEKLKSVTEGRMCSAE